jgi:hypothetical protein
MVVTVNVTRFVLVIQANQVDIASVAVAITMPV